MPKKEQIINTAIDLFATIGYDATSIQQLAQESGVAQGLLYRHFRNKEALLQHLVTMGLEQIATTLAPYHDPAIGFKEAFRRHVSLCCSYMQQHTRLWKVLHSTRLHLATMAPGLPAIDIRAVVIKPIAAKLAADGHNQPEVTAWTLLALIDGITAMYLMHPTEYPLSKVKKFLLQQIELYDK